MSFIYRFCHNIIIQTFRCKDNEFLSIIVYVLHFFLLKLVAVSNFREELVEVKHLDGGTLAVVGTDGAVVVG